MFEEITKNLNGHQLLAFSREAPKQSSKTINRCVMPYVQFGINWGKQIHLGLIFK